MNIDDDFNLKSGMFVTCAKIVDKKTGKLRPADATEMVQCCSNKCIEPVEFCQNYCRTKYTDKPNLLKRCSDMCINQRDMCLDTCRLSSKYSEPQNNYNKCAFKFGCRGLYGFPDSECVKKHRAKIYDCCRKTCVPNRDLDCEDHCKFSEKIALDLSTFGAPKTGMHPFDKLVSSKKINTKYSNQSGKYIVIALIIAILILLFIYFKDVI